jgi:hypothetical protein
VFLSRQRTRADPDWTWGVNRMDDPRESEGSPGVRGPASLSEGYGSSSQDLYLPARGRSSPLPPHVGRFGRARVRAPSHSPRRARASRHPGQVYPTRVGRGRHSSSSSQSRGRSDRGRARGQSRYADARGRAAHGRTSTSSPTPAAGEGLAGTASVMDMRECACCSHSWRTRTLLIALWHPVVSSLAHQQFAISECSACRSLPPAAGDCFVAPLKLLLWGVDHRCSQCVKAYSDTVVALSMRAVRRPRVTPLHSSLCGTRAKVVCQHFVSVSNIRQRHCGVQAEGSDRKL